MEKQKRILGNIVGHQLSKEDLQLISGGTDCPTGAVCCNGCEVNTSSWGPYGPGCHCDSVP